MKKKLRAKSKYYRYYFCYSFTVCIETYRIGETVRILPCNHRFHKSCIDQWLLARRTCPMCKMDILKHYGLIHEEETSLEDREETMFNIAWWFHGKTKQNIYKTKKRRHWKCMCLYNYTYCLFTENKEAVTIKKIVLNFCSCYNLSDFCDKFVCTIIPNSLSWKKLIQVAAYMYFLLFVIFFPAPILSKLCSCL